MITPSKSGTRSNRLLVIGILLITMVVGAACTSAEPSEVTRIVEVPGPEFEVTRIVKVPGEEIEVTRIVEAIAEPEPETIPDEEEAYPLATLPGTEVRILSSDSTGRDYKISVALPRNYEIYNQNYPVLYVLDANQVFGFVTEYSRALATEDLAETILVSIGYETNKMGDITYLRQRDFVLEDAEFLQFIREELMPVINAEYRVNPDEAAILGHSLGGLFTIYALFQEPHVFSGYIIGSPPLDDEYFDYEVSYAEDNSDLSATVYMGVGTVNDVSSLLVQRFARTLEERGYENLELTTTVFDGETHISVAPDIVNHGMQIVFE